MNTKVVKIEREKINDQILLEAARMIREGRLIAFPTETVYGLGANALDPEAAKKIYAAKGRPSDNPLIAHIAGPEDLPPLVAKIPDTAKRLMDAFWPGPLTIIFPKSNNVPYETTGGLDTVAVRSPKDCIAQRLIQLAGVPIAAPSANTSGRPSPTLAEHVYQDMNGKIDMIMEGGAVGIGVESTIIDVSGSVPILLRPGAVTLEMLEETIGDVELDQAVLGPVSQGQKPKAPGMKYRHYAPRAELILVEEEGTVSDKVITIIKELTEEKSRQGAKVGIICTDETVSQYTQGVIRSLGSRMREETIAHNLFAVLREFDELEVDYIFSESFPESHLGQAIRNRLTKAAGYHVIEVGENK